MVLQDSQFLSNLKYYYNSIFHSPNNHIFMIFGLCGSGKSCYAIWLMEKYRKKGIEVYHNISSYSYGTYVNVDKLFSYTFSNDAILVIDECSIEFNNRQYKNLSINTIKFIKEYRKHKISNVYLLSQSWEDVDITFRRLTDRICYLKKLGPFTKVKPIVKVLTIDKERQQIVDGYRFADFWDKLFTPYTRTKIFFRPSVYRKFNTYEISKGSSGSVTM